MLRKSSVVTDVSTECSTHTESGELTLAAPAAACDVISMMLSDIRAITLS